jgi:hypothetical protein
VCGTSLSWCHGLRLHSSLSFGVALSLTLISQPDVLICLTF